MGKEKLIVVSAPSGSGKTTLIKHLIATLPIFDFSVSATSRAPRKGEINGKDYHFISADEFRKLIAENGFIEWEEVYPDRFYGTLKSEISRIALLGKIALFDVDVKGGVNIKKLYKKQALSIFLKAPSIKVLEQRLRDRGTDSETDIQTRVQKAAEELTYAQEFDFVITNDDRQKAKEEFVGIVRKFIDS